jgi:predicted nucleotidyltransferase
MKAPDLTLVREFKRRAEQALPGRVVRVMLYGSRARGGARPDSDWDIAVFMTGKPTSDDLDILSDIGFDLMLEHGQYFQAIPIDAARTQEQSHFVQNVLKDGLAA